MSSGSSPVEALIDDVHDSLSWRRWHQNDVGYRTGKCWSLILRCLFPPYSSSEWMEATWTARMKIRVNWLLTMFSRTIIGYPHKHGNSPHNPINMVISPMNWLLVITLLIGLPWLHYPRELHPTADPSWHICWLANMAVAATIPWGVCWGSATKQVLVIS